MRHIPFIYFSHILPLDYDLSLTPYEIISKLLKWLDGLTGTVNGHSEAINELARELAELAHKDDTKIYEALNQMLTEGKFDFLMDLYTGSTIFNQLAGIEPFGQLAPDVLAAFGNFASSPDKTAVAMAIGPQSGIPYTMMAFCNSDYTESELVTFNLTSGSVFSHAVNTAKTHIGDLGYNPKDQLYYAAGGSEKIDGLTYISAYDLNCQHVKDISGYADSRIGHICFLEDGTCYVIQMSNSNDKLQYLKVYSDITDIVAFDSAEADAKLLATIPYNIPSTHQRQGMFTDGAFLYVLRGHFGTKYDITNRYQVIDIFSLANKIPAYFQTITLDAEMEMETGDFYDGNYFINFNALKSGFICKAAIKAQDLLIDNNRAYSQLGHARQVAKLGSSSAEIYVNGGALNYRVDGSDGYPYLRLDTALRMLPNKPQDGITLHLSGDLTVGGTYTRTMCRCVRERITMAGDGTAILPYQVAAHDADIRYSNLSIKGSTDQCIQIYETGHAELNNVTFIPAEGGTTNIIDIQASEAVLTGCQISEGTFTRAINAQLGSKLSGRLEYSGTNTRIGEYSLTAGSNLTNYYAYMTIDNSGIDVFMHFRATDDIAAGAVIAAMPDTYKVRWYCDRLALPSDPYLAAGDNRIFYSYADKQFKTSLAISSGQALVITGRIPFGSNISI